jgi:hypothetical protein
LKGNRREGGFLAPAPNTMHIAFRVGLEVILEGKLDDPTAVFVCDLSEIIQRILREAESSSGIAEVGPRAAVTIRSRRYPTVANRGERKIDVAIIRVAVA